MKTIAKLLYLVLSINIAIPTLMASETSSKWVIQRTHSGSMVRAGQIKEERREKETPNYLSGFLNTLASVCSGYVAYDFLMQAKGEKTLVSKEINNLYDSYLATHLNTTDDNKALLLRVSRGGIGAIFGSLSAILGVKAIRDLNLIK